MNNKKNVNKDEDLKKYLKISYEQVKKSLNKGMLKFINTENKSVEYWVDYFTYNPDLSALENFCRYRVASAFKLYDGCDDADKTSEVMEYFKEILSNIDGVSNVKVGVKKDRVFEFCYNNDVLYLETDTAISLMYDFGDFMREIIDRVAGLPTKTNWPEETYIKKYNLPKWSNEKYKPFRTYYWGEIQKDIRENIHNNLSKEELECYKSFEERAKHIHTIKNMMLVPYGYNSARGSRLSTYKTKQKIKDRLYLTVRDFEEMLEDEEMNNTKFQKRLNLKKNEECATLKSVEFLLEHKNLLIPQVPDNGKTIEKVLLVINNSINEIYK